MPLDVIALRQKLVDERGLRVTRIFDTAQKSGGVKDVSLCVNPDGRKEILRIGEARPAPFFPDGYDGAAMVVPRLYERGDDPVPFEREAYLEGTLGIEDRRLEAEGQIAPDVLEKLLAAFWEFRAVSTSLSLPVKPTTEKIRKHLDGARSFFREPERVSAVIEAHTDFWEKPFPSKWKFDLGNVVLIPDGRVGLVDNVNVGRRWFGYDLGWMIWPRWIAMATEAYARPMDQITYLESFLAAAKRGMPSGLMSDSDFHQAFWLVVFERLIGAAYDAAVFTSHMAHHGMGRNDPPERRDAHVSFLLNMMEIVLDRLI